MAFKVPIYAGIFLTKPTMFNTGFWQFTNQSYMAGLTFFNKNASCPYSNQDLLFGFGAAVVTSVGISLMMRKLTTGLIAGRSGNSFLAVNLLVNASAASAANVANTLCMRQSEIKRGIKVYKDP